MSNVTGKEDRSYSKEDVGLKKGNLSTTKTVVFKDERGAGDLVINTMALITPTEAASNGFLQPSVAQLNALNLIQNRKNIQVHSSLSGIMVDYETYAVTGANTIQLIGNKAALGGAAEGEVFTVKAVPVQTSSLLTTDAKKQYKEYILPDGQAILNLGREFDFGANIDSQIGSIRVFRNGVGPLLRNVANVVANPSADGDYHEISTGSLASTMIEFNIAPSGQDDTIVVEFGLEYAADLSIVGDQESLAGQLLAMAKDVGPAVGVNPNDWIISSPSQVERNEFGDEVLRLGKLYDVLEKLSEYTKTRTIVKILPSDIVELNTTVAALTLPIIIGRKYRVFYQASISSPDSNNVSLNCVHDGETLGRVENEGASTADDNMTSGTTTRVFVATVNQVTFVTAGMVVGGASDILNGNGTGSETFVQIDELPNHEIVSVFT